MSILFYDFEVTKYDWLVVFKESAKKFTVICNDRESLYNYWQKHINDVFVGYNSAHYDKFIFADIINNNHNPYELSKAIVSGKLDMLEIYKYAGNLDFINFDIMGADKLKSLKQLELFMGENIEESKTDFDIDRKLTRSELNEMITYCKHDVNMTEQVFTARLNYFKSHVNLIKTFDLPFRKSMGMSQARLTAEILKCSPKSFNDEHKAEILSCIKIGKYQEIYNWFLRRKHLEDVVTKSGKVKSNSLEADVFGIPHKFGLGGLHGCVSKPVQLEGNLLHIDVASYYPSLMIKHGLLTRASRQPERYPVIYDTRLKLKHEGKKEEQAPYKIVLNATYGICKDNLSKAFDPRRAIEICMNGQLMLVDLLDKLEDANCCRLIQSNTDGIIVQFTNYEKVVSICEEWCERTRMVLEYEPIKKLVQKDVNNYICVFEDGKIETKGPMVKYNTSLDNNLAIRNIALREYFINGTDIWHTLLTHNNAVDYQITVKRSMNYDRLWIGDQPTSNKTLRVFACRNGVAIGKQKGTGTIEKYGNTPESCKVFNGKVADLSCKDLGIDKTWYYKKIQEDLKLWL